MGLKTTNYTIKKNGLFLPVAYAKLDTLVKQKSGRIDATFAIHKTRQELDTFDEPLEVVRVSTKNVWDRKTPLEKVAYEAIKSETYTETDLETGVEVVKTDYNALFGWQDDIV